MNSKKIAIKNLFDRNEIFADVFNWRMHDGNKVIQPDDLANLPLKPSCAKEIRNVESFGGVAKHWKNRADLILVFIGMDSVLPDEEELILQINNFERQCYERMIRENLMPVPCYTVVLNFSLEQSWPKDSIWI